MLHVYFQNRYDFEIKNDLGSVGGSTVLIVEENNISTQNSTAVTQHPTAATDVLEKTTNLVSNPIDQEKFGEYVAGLHLMNNRAFETQYKVC